LLQTHANSFSITPWSNTNKWNVCIHKKMTTSTNGKAYYKPPTNSFSAHEIIQTNEASSIVVKDNHF
jgi:hypothetical protein